MADFEDFFLTAAIIFLLAFLLSPNADAGQLMPRWAFEKNAADEGLGGGERLYALGYACALGDSSRLKTEVGGWVSKSTDRESSMFGSVQWGYRAELFSGFAFETAVGPAWIAKTDSRLGSHLQIKYEFGFSWQNATGWGFAVDYGHFSNGSLFPGPNAGRDFFGLRSIIHL